MPSKKTSLIHCCFAILNRLVLQELKYTSVDVETFLNHLDGLNDKNTDVLKDFTTEEPQTLNQSQPETSGAGQSAFFKEDPCAATRPSTSILLKRNTICSSTALSRSH